jgi:hypothetical protein
MPLGRESGCSIRVTCATAGGAAAEKRIGSRRTASARIECLTADLHDQTATILMKSYYTMECHKVIIGGTGRPGDDGAVAFAGDWRS